MTTPPKETNESMTMDKIKLKDELAQLQKRVDNLKAIVEAPDNTNVRRRAEDGQIYRCVDEDGDVVYHKEGGNYDDNFRYYTGNYFKTGEEAKHYKKVLLATQKVKDRIAELNAEQGWVLDWDKEEQEKFVFKYTAGAASKGLYIMYCTANQVTHQDFYGSEETIETVVHELPEECKLVLGVE